MSAPDRRAMVERPGKDLSVRRQCALVGVARSGVYRPKPVTGADDLAVMRRIDELHLELPFYGSRRMTFELNKEGRGVNRKRVRRLMRVMGIEALAPRPGTSKAARLMTPVSNDTLLRVVRRRARLPTNPLAVIGVDDFAWRRNHRYGTIVCDLERRQPVVLLPDREQATAEAWLSLHPNLAVVARDRGGGYGEAVAKALPHAIQVADRWHLMQNASRAFLDAVRKSMRQIRGVIGATTVNPALLTSAERIQYEGYLRREEMNDAILALWKDGAHQADRSTDRTSSPDGAPDHPRRTIGRLQVSAKLARGASPMA